MALRRIFVDRVAGERAAVSGDKAHHLRRVARLREGEAVELSDGERLYPARVTTLGAAEVVFATDGPAREAPRRGRIELRLAVIKFHRWEWALEKAVELGVATIVPVAAARSEAALVRAAAKRAHRWRRIAEEAAEQSRQVRPPEVTAPVSFDEAVERPAEARAFVDFDGQPLAELLDEIEPRPGRTTALLVGPEGGWTEEERAAARGAGWRPAALADSVLRTETAALAALAVLTIGRRGTERTHG